MGKTKKTGKESFQRDKPTAKKEIPDNQKNPIWTFRNIDRDGKFAFNPSRKEFNAEEFVEKMLAYSNMTWQEILRQTHDNGKSKHHTLNNLDRLSKDARERIQKKNVKPDDADSLFSFALNNITRVIGIRNGAEFQVIWYDANHKFYPSEKKHT